MSMSLRTSIELQDNFSSTMHSIIKSVNLSLRAMDGLHSSVNTPLDASTFSDIRNNLDRATLDLQKFDEMYKSIDLKQIEIPKIDINWTSPNFDVFDSTGLDRFNQELNSANILIDKLSKGHNDLANTASKIDILPQNMVDDIASVQRHIEGIRSKIRELESTPKSLFDDNTNAQLEILRSNLSQAVEHQNDLNSAVRNMDIGAANQAYSKLSTTVNSTKQYIRDNMNSQQGFNNKIGHGQREASKLTSTIKSAVGAYATIQSVKMVLNVSDNLTSTTARLDLMNDGLQTTDELQQMIYNSAERSRGSYQAVSDAVSKLGLMAGDAFSSSAEIIAFTEQINKHFAIAGTTASGVEAAMLQLTQAMGSGVLRGEEFNSIMEQAPNIMATIAEYMGVSTGALKNLASEGKITAEIVKNAMFAAAEETNAKFDSMPKTFAQIFTSLKNNALIAFQPLLTKISELANSSSFQSLIQGIINGLSFVASIAVDVFSVLSSIGGFIAENWSIISPIILGVAAAMGIYTAAVIANNVANSIGIAIKGMIALKEGVVAAYRTMATGATFAQTVAQHGLNAALLACPLTWIILLIIAFIAIVFAAANAIAKWTGISQTGFGVICGAINVVIQFFVNLFKVAANICIGIGNAVGALGHNMKTAFFNSITNIQSWFYDLLSTCLNVVSGICKALNKLPFVNIDYSGITSKANEYANKSASLQSSKGEYKSILGAFKSGANTFDAFSDGWVQNAFNQGSSWGDSFNKSAKISDFNSNLELSNTGSFNANSQNIPTSPSVINGSGIQNSLSDMGSGINDVASNTGDIKNSLDKSQEELKYLRDIAERDTINRFTTAEIKVDMGGITNNVNSNMDLNGIIDKLTIGVNEAMERVAEGVYA